MAYSKMDYMRLIAKVIENYFKNECLIIFFGSILTDRFNRTSDIDVAIYCKKDLGFKDYIALEEELEKVPILRDIDLVDIKTIKNLEFLESILKEGKVWRSSTELLTDLKRHIESLKR
jgi:predicted nucleotidyltransferase